MLFVARCPGCGELNSGRCHACVEVLVRAPVTHRSGIIVSHEYVGVMRELIVAMKYSSMRWIAPMLADLWVERCAAVCDVDRVTWVPTTPARARDRGFDQSEIIARRIARRMALPCTRLLRRTDDVAQTGRSARERRDGAHFVARGGDLGRVLVVDDVVTTGSTMRHAVSSLVVAGATAVTAGAIAATPTPEGRG